MIHLFFCLLMFSFFSCNQFGEKNFYSKIENGEKPPFYLSSVLSQKFTYLGEGAQIYAFASEDGKYVLKLFKKKHKKPFKLSRFFPHLLRTPKDWEESQKRWDQKFQNTCKCYQLAYNHLKEESGLVFLHFTKTTPSLPTTLVFHSPKQVDLSPYPFVIQKRATLIPDYLKEHPEKVDQTKDALKEFFAQRTKKGFSDPRQSLRINYGFVGDRPIQIDVGKLQPFEGDEKAELHRIYSHINDWISKQTKL